MIRRLMVALVDAYRRWISPGLPPFCRFIPSCSLYAREAFLRHGVLKGGLLVLWRLLRCQPFSRSGPYDPVPPPGRWRVTPPPEDGAPRPSGGD